MKASIKLDIPLEDSDFMERIISVEFAEANPFNHKWEVYLTPSNDVEGYKYFRPNELVFEHHHEEMLFYKLLNIKAIIE